MRLSVVIAALDERQNVEPLTRRLAAVLDGLAGHTWEIVYVVEGTDGTRDVLETLAGEIPGIRVLYQPEPQGLGAAFRRGFAAAAPDADVVVTMDADLNHQPEELPRLLEAFLGRGCDILVGSRFTPGGSVDRVPAWKIALSRSLNPLMRLAFRMNVRDLTSGYRLYRREALRAVPFSSNNFAFLPELLFEAAARGLRIEEAPIRFTYRIHGRSKMALWRTSCSYVGLFLRRLTGTAAR
ncbi:MAG: glycosyltransferase [Holophagales bacterium]|nr:glycosyltransferase [Holophagales bacterium]